MYGRVLDGYPENYQLTLGGAPSRGPTLPPAGTSFCRRTSFLQPILRTNQSQLPLYGSVTPSRKYIVCKPPIR